MKIDYPKNTYRYYANTSRNIESLETPYLWFSKLHNMNDPFEGMHVFNISNFSIPRAIKIIKNLYINKGMPPYEAERVVVERYMSIPPAQIEQTLKTVLIEGHRSAMELLKSNGFCCLFGSEAAIENTMTAAQQIMMWSHYANGLRGFRVEFDTEMLLGTLNEAPTVNPVTYHEAPGESEIIDIMERAGPSNMDEQIDEIMMAIFRKHTFWAAENELRLGVRSEGRQSFSLQAIKRIVIGSKMPKRDLDKLLDVIGNFSHQVPVSTAKPDTRSYKIVITPGTP